MPQEPFSISQFIDALKRDNLVRAYIPMGYAPTLPLIAAHGQEVRLLIPFARYQATGKVDQTLVYPPKYVIEFMLPSKRLLRWQDLMTHRAFAKIDFNQPIGTFRHEAVKHLDKEQYATLRQDLYALYDKAIAAILAGEEMNLRERSLFTSLLNQMLEPCFYPVYQALNPVFAKEYLK